MLLGRQTNYSTEKSGGDDEKMTNHLHAYLPPKKRNQYYNKKLIFRTASNWLEKVRLEFD